MRNLLAAFIVLLFSTNARSQSLYFPPITGNTWDTISPLSLNWCQDRIDSLYTYLDTNNTKAFILLKDGKIVLEKYFGTQTQSSVWQWASAGKTLTSFLVGIAQQEGHLSITDTTSKYLGQGWTSCTPAQEEKITIRNQLTMTTGLDDGVPDNHCTLDSCLLYLADAGTRWAYHNAPYTLLDNVINNATGFTMNAYATQKLKTPIGMTGAFVPINYDNVYFSNARSMARFGLLILNNGNWDGNQIMTDTAYFNQMINTSQMLNKSYGYLWWLNGKASYMLPQLQLVIPGYLCPHAPADMIAALGKDGQFINVIPSMNMVWIRMGESPDSLPVPYLMDDVIWQYINNLTCGGPTGLSEQTMIDNSVSLYPNPTGNELNINSNKLFNKVEILNMQGQVIRLLNTDNRVVTLSVSELPKGFYFVKTYFTDGSVWTGKMVRQ
ncbi:MAG: serine hydrolase [Bacteroidetes bacterium]|jgi:CubicO group peptidase (beta-lactamase class C family)|nr:serine hydrolase [Bacteroidota bacterium]